MCLPLRGQGRQQPVLAIALAIQLADVLRLGTTETLDRQVGILAITMRPGCLVIPGGTSGLGGIAKAIFPHPQMDMVYQAGGEQRRKQVVTAVIQGEIQLLGERMRRRRTSAAGNAGEGVPPCLRQVYIVGESRF
ncbi:hypothetical protein D3C78_1501700 [compost metagenome]